MDTNVAKQIMITTLQRGLTGNLKLHANITPQKLADAIIAKIDFSKPYSEMENERLVSTLIDSINNLDKEMREELDTLKREEKLLANFIHGKLTAYAEILNIIKSL